MKAIIDPLGKLSVIPETQTESFALKQWWKEYMKAQGADGAPCEVTLNICHIVEEPDHE